MITPMRMSAPTPKSMPWPTPQRPAQAAPVRRELLQPGGNPGGQECGGIHPAITHRLTKTEDRYYLDPFGDDSD